MNRGLVAALVVLAALVAGGFLGLLLVALPGSGPPATPAPPPPAPRTTPSSQAPEADRVATTVVANALVHAMSAADTTEFGALACRPQTAEALARLQSRWDATGPMRVTLAAPPLVSGDEATATVHVEAEGGHKDTAFPLRRENGRWCLAD
ncbi:hypothetical protein [Amycolatopsis jiangsuensis]|uniref:Uncharacterized protein n=1 Tax=Amycolatopsis jiangsuensis TaxID=1181879 RepID=A0A840IR17_9PSEU|nr:hypothetical protein [Amycolatopsis jiangsuensis]MBB4683618.1 hypothetical protein [Amycolatopsis jiangsuensis]